jgi:uncharacterized protein YndB with AHSA1/START domain
VTSRVILSLRMAATPQRVFDAFTREIAAWWRPNALFHFTPRSPGVLAFEPGVGGRFTETFDDGSVFEIGRVTVWQPGALLAFTWRQASFAPDQVTTVHVKFEAVDAQTRVTVEHRGWETVPQEHVARHHFPDAVFLLRHAEWWKAQLGRLGMAVAGDT